MRCLSAVAELLVVAVLGRHVSDIMTELVTQNGRKAATKRQQSIKARSTNSEFGLGVGNVTAKTATSCDKMRDN